MQRRAVTMTVLAVLVAVTVIGLPLAVLGPFVVYRSEQDAVELRAASLMRTVERRIAHREDITDSLLRPWVGRDTQNPAYIELQLSDGTKLTAGEPISGKVLRATQSSPSGYNLLMEVSTKRFLLKTVYVEGFILVGTSLAFLIAVLVARRQARKIAAPLIYLAASAEQLGSGQARPRIKPSGIEEIDLIQAELVRTAERMAGRLAAERQFAADASHQLRTPLTALSMRLEEIELLATDEGVKEEARVCLEQVERLTGVVDELLKTSRSSSGGTTEAVSITDVFDQQRDEWQRAFDNAGRELVFSEGTDRLALATPGSVAQVLATLIENSLKYGDGTTTVSSRPASGKGVFIDVADEGSGVPDELANDIFSKHVSGKGGTGLGLALAKDLASSDGGRLELSQRRPPVFTLFLNGVPASLNPNAVLPQGSFVSVGRRRRRR
ncbi:two-component sensor histidine kinase [Bowdeniella nasicola]|uniref:Signal transduction histidine-protein kinase/phosphatase MprB n=1 Tax=Bowdeniella nasicola TaxID=208480 RepID=A0A1Q5Q2D3_9ACTO|nr:ATP-binding protein [Bowdeniella nasicola]OKL54014.1 two-component sensor histidine kinase [Bowdeniella nasicola]